MVARLVCVSAVWDNLALMVSGVSVRCSREQEALFKKRLERMSLTSRSLLNSYLQLHLEIGVRACIKAIGDRSGTLASRDNLKMPADSGGGPKVGDDGSWC
ncbi:hypothetical protein CYLTODRAFT_415069 [Cylindrobasidium torrendii FP15055 ss-10]|uniref:Uncharacterized protein n=1 Tax=Cylindrobasidium torrendii FP15055 ss-10 TaxID=1314674 RepID=A0A0D7AVT4_9AGAR|nr:hypothetical protein CYLTODRAFT_415069 [Cylindrobasidium torrendii FP15055 ss-10]